MKERIEELEVDLDSAAEHLEKAEQVDKKEVERLQKQRKELQAALTKAEEEKRDMQKKYAVNQRLVVSWSAGRGGS